MFLTFEAIREDTPGRKWQTLFTRFWPAYRRWFLSEGHLARPGWVTSRRMLAEHMPELVPVYEQLEDLAGGGDVAARFLSLYRPPPYLAGCSQAVWTDGAPRLVRNYDYSPDRFEGVLLRSAWLRPVLASTDCAWGALDGVNDAGLAAALAFGGRAITGDGFGVPILIRYVLETCESVGEAIRALRRVPSHMTYSVTLLDRSGEFATAYLAPDRSAAISDARACTNHQMDVEWQDYVRMTASVTRRQHLDDLLERTQSFSRFVKGFLQPPLHATDFHRGFGTLYTAVYAPDAMRGTFRWPHHEPLELDLHDFREQERVVDLRRSQVSSLVE